jgi:hypothetical protein
MTTVQITHALMARVLYEANSSVECFSIEDLRELQLPNLGSQADPDTSWLPPLPDRVLVTTEAEEEEAITLLDHLFQAHMDAWSLKDRDQVFSRGTRFEDENPAPQYPLITKNSRRTSDPSRRATGPPTRCAALADTLWHPRSAAPPRGAPRRVHTRRPREMSVLPRLTSGSTQSGAGRLGTFLRG